MQVFQRWSGGGQWSGLKKKKKKSQNFGCTVLL